MCLARVHTIGTQGPIVSMWSNEDDIRCHNHKPDHTLLRRHQYTDEIKTAASVNITETPRTLITNASTILNEEEAAKVVRNDNITQSIHYAQKKNKHKLPVMHHRQDIILTDILMTTLTGLMFLFIDTGIEDVNRIIMFATIDNIRRLSEFNNWYGDGTFAASPKIFYQVFTLHILKNGKTLPMLYSLLLNKEQKTYECMFKLIKSELTRDPATLSVDYEK